MLETWISKIFTELAPMYGQDTMDVIKEKLIKLQQLNDDHENVSYQELQQCIAAEHLYMYMFEQRHPKAEQIYSRITEHLAKTDIGHGRFLAWVNTLNITKGTWRRFLKEHDDVVSQNNRVFLNNFVIKCVAPVQEQNIFSKNEFELCYELEMIQKGKTENSANVQQCVDNLLELDPVDLSIEQQHMIQNWVKEDPSTWILPITAVPYKRNAISKYPRWATIFNHQECHRSNTIGQTLKEVDALSIQSIPAKLENIYHVDRSNMTELCTGVILAFIKAYEHEQSKGNTSTRNSMVIRFMHLKNQLAKTDHDAWLHASTLLTAWSTKNNILNNDLLLPDLQVWIDKESKRNRNANPHPWQEKIWSIPVDTLITWYTKGADISTAPVATDMRPLDVPLEREFE